MQLATVAVLLALLKRLTVRAHAEQCICILVDFRRRCVVARQC